MAGLVSEYTRYDVPAARKARLWASVLPVVEKILPRLSLDYALEWADALRYVKPAS